jgi:hypothetical protein
MRGTWRGCARQGVFEPREDLQTELAGAPGSGRIQMQVCLGARTLGPLRNAYLSLDNEMVCTDWPRNGAPHSKWVAYRGEYAGRQQRTWRVWQYFAYIAIENTRAGQLQKLILPGIILDGEGGCLSNTTTEA